MLSFITRICHFSSILKSVDVHIKDSEIAMTVLNGLPPSFDYIITALDAIGNDATLSLDLVKSSLLQEEQRL